MFEQILFFMGAIIVGFIQKAGYLGVFVLIFFGSAAVPIPSEAVLSFSGFLMADGVFSFWLLLSASLLGNFAGFSFLYFIGVRFHNLVYESRTVKRFIGARNLAKAEKWIREKGIVAVFAGAMIPLIRSYFALPGGILRIKYKKFIFFALAGSAVWNSIWIYAGFNLGENWIQAESYVRKFSFFILLTGFILIVAVFRKKFFSSTKHH